MKSITHRSFLIVAALVCVSFAAPKPSMVPKPDVWTLEVTFEQPQQLILNGPSGATPRVFWYIILTLTNRSFNDVDFYPRCDLMTDTFQIVPAGKFTTPEVFDLIKKRHQGKYPLLESRGNVANRILQGADNAKDIAIIWPDFDPNAVSFKIFISGLGNETVAVEDPVQKGRMVYLRKTLELDYALHGDPALRPYLRLDYKGKNWVMR